MLKTLKALLSASQRADAPASDVAAALAEAEREIAAATAAQESAEKEYRGGLLTADDAGLRRLADARTESSMRLDRASALRDVLADKLAAAQAREAEAARVAAYEAAVAQADQAREVLRLYPDLAAEIVGILSAVAAAEIVVVRVNADLPAGAEPIAGVETSVRDGRRQPEVVIDEYPVERWVEEGKIDPGAIDQNAVQATGRGRGIIGPHSNGGGHSFGVKHFELRTFTAQVYHPAELRAAADDLAGKLMLPGFLGGDLPIFEPIFQPSPDQVLAHVARADAEAGKPEEERPVKTRLIPEPGAQPVQSPHREDVLERLSKSAEEGSAGVNGRRHPGDAPRPSSHHPALAHAPATYEVPAGSR